MEMNAGTHVDDYNASFRDTVWLQSFPLTEQTVIHYFALSPFYDRSCNNERLKMQRLELDRLKSMRGIEYENVPVPPPAQGQQYSLFLVRKQRRISPHQVKPLAMYYVLDGTVYQAPNLHAMLTSRLKKCSYRVNQAFQGLKAGVRYAPTEGYAWDFSTDENKHKPIPSEQLAQRLKAKHEEDQERARHGARIETILVDLLKKYVPDVIEAAADSLNKDSTATEEEEEKETKRQRVE